MTRDADEGDRTPAALDRRGFKVLSLAAGVALLVLVAALGSPERDVDTAPWSEPAPAVVPTAAGARAVAADADGLDVETA